MNLITDNQITWNSGPFSREYDTIKVVQGERKWYRHGDETFATKSALRRTLSSEYNGAWIEEKDGKRRYFIDESVWFKRSIREVSKEEFVHHLDTPSTCQKVLGLGLGILALAPGVSEWARHIPKETGLGLLALKPRNPLLGALGYSFLANAQAIGTEFQVNTYTSGDQMTPAVIGFQRGGFTVVWQSNGQDGDSFGIFGKRYNSDGSLNSAEFQVNTFSTNFQQNPSLGAWVDGDFIVAWHSNAQDGDSLGIYAQLYDRSNGSRAGNEFQVNVYTASSQELPSIAVLISGEFIVTWDSAGQDGDSLGIFGRAFYRNGTNARTEFQVNTYTTNSQAAPSIAALSNGGYVIVWQSNGQDGNSWGIFGNNYGSDFAQIGSEFMVNNYTNFAQWHPKIASLAGGGFIVVWESNGQDGDSYGIFCRKFTDNAAKEGSELQVNSYTTNQQTFPSVVGLIDGSFVVVWQSEGQDGNAAGIYGKSFDRNLTSGSEFQVNSYISGSQERPSVAALSDGGFVVVWQSSGQDGNGYGVFGQRYSSSGDPVSLLSTMPESSLFATSLIPSVSGSTPYQSSSSQFTQRESSLPSTSVSNSQSAETTLHESSIFSITRQNTSSQYTDSLSPNLSSSVSIQRSSLPIETSLDSSSSISVSEWTTPTNLNPPSSRINSLGIVIHSIVDLIYGESYPIYINGQTIGTYTISGGSGLLDSNNPNVLNIQFNPGFAPEEEENITLFTIPLGQENLWELVIDTENLECLEAHAEINPSTSGGSDFGLVFTGAASCTADASLVAAGILPIMMN